MSTEYIRKGFILHLLPGNEEEYKRRHDEIWPELVTLLKAHGGRHYSIFLEAHTCQLFAYVEIESEQRWEEVANSPICQKWWRYMEDIMQTNADHSPLVTPLRPVFYMH